MQLSFTPEQDAFRLEVRQWLQSHVPQTRLPSFDTEAGFALHREWERTLAKGNFGMVTWPKDYGGRGLNLIEWLIFEEEYYRAGAPGRVNQNGIFLLGPTLMEFGTDEQKARFLPAMASGDEIWAQAWSEPQAGSDLAAVATTAVRDGDHYVLKGHKIWSSRAVFADWAFVLVRTEAGSQRHKGLSLVLMDLKTEGVTVNPIPQIDGEAGFAEIFLENARVPVANRLGDEGQGWHVCMATAGFERGLMLRSPARYQEAARKLSALYLEHQDRLDPAIGRDVAQSWMNAQAYALSIYSTACRLQAGGSIGAEASCNKIFWSEMDIALHQIALAILGPYAELAEPMADNHDWLGGYLFSLAGPIYAGSNEIQRNIIAERVLGMPRG